MSQTVMPVAALIEAIERGKGAKFASMTYRAKQTGELAKRTLILGASTETMYEKDIVILDRLLSDDELPTLLRQAAQAIRDSRMESLTVGIGNNSKYACRGVYIAPMTLTQGIFLHKEKGEIYVKGLVQSKTVVESGTYKERNSSDLTIAKQAVMKLLPSGTFRQFILRNIVRAAVNGEVLEFEEASIVDVK